MPKIKKYSILHILKYSNDNVFATFVINTWIGNKPLSLCIGTYNFVEEKTCILKMYDVLKHMEFSFQKEIIFKELSKHDWERNIEFL